MKGSIVILLFLLTFTTASYTQELTYFNNIYNPENTFANGRGILQIDDYYYGIFGTWTPPNYNYQLGVFKMSETGELLDYSLFGEEGYHYYYGTVGGTLIQTLDQNLAIACHIESSDGVFGHLMKLNMNLELIWEKSYSTEHETTTIIKGKQTVDGGYILFGWAYPGTSYYLDGLIIKTDSSGSEEWHQLYGVNNSSSEYCTDVIETPDGGYLIGGMKDIEAIDHSLDAMVIKTDSLGNEERTHTYGNPNVDDDMALVAMADDGNYLVATVYGDETFAPSARSGRIFLIKVDNNGNPVWEKKIGPNRINIWIKNFRVTSNGYIISGFSYETDSSTFQYNSGWMMKLDSNLDSIWYRDYLHEDVEWESYFYDAYATSDNGYIAIGKARPDIGGNNKMWIVKVDSMGCDTPGCATGVQVFDIPAGYQQGIWVWPNPTSGMFQVSGLPAVQAGCMFQVAGPKIIRVYNSQGVKVEEVMVPEKVESFRVDASRYPNGLYYLQLISNDQVIDVAKFIKY